MNIEGNQIKNEAVKPKTEKEEAQDFYENVDFPTDVVDIALCGSLCNYNWSEKYSDYDLHVIIDFDKVDLPKKEITNYFFKKYIM